MAPDNRFLSHTSLYQPKLSPCLPRSISLSRCRQSRILSDT